MTNSTQHTPGPLPLLELHRGEDYAAIMRPDDTTETALVIVRYPRDEDMPLLQAMTAAPALLAALKAIVAKIDPAILVERDLPNSEMADEYRAAEAAIAQAEGR